MDLLDALLKASEDIANNPDGLIRRRHLLAAKALMAPAPAAPSPEKPA